MLPQRTIFTVGRATLTILVASLKFDDRLITSKLIKGMNGKHHKHEHRSTTIFRNTAIQVKFVAHLGRHRWWQQ